MPGAYGIICPMINSREEAERFVGACRYAPQGYRSVGPVRALMYGGDDYVAEANGTVLAIAMVETEAAVRNIDDILTTPGLDGIYVGPADLCVSMGEKASHDPEYPNVKQAIHHIAARCRHHGIPGGIHTGSVRNALAMKDLGFRFITLMNDLRLVQWAAGNAVRALRAGQPSPDAP